jgi:hypothetical protein
VEVVAERFDDYWQQHGGPVHFVKIDVEGAEGFVLDGMTRILQDEPRLSILLEYAPERLVETGYEPRSLLDGLASQGYEIWHIDSSRRSTVPSSTDEILRVLAPDDMVYANLLLDRIAEPSGG